MVECLAVLLSNINSVPTFEGDTGGDGGMCDMSSRVCASAAGVLARHTVAGTEGYCATCLWPLYICLPSSSCVENTAQSHFSEGI